MDHRGWLKLWRSLRDSTAGTTATSTGIWVHLLMRASHERRMLRNGLTLERGELLISERALADDLDVGRKVLRNHLETYEREGMILRLSAGRNGTRIQILNWDLHQASARKGAQSGAQSEPPATDDGEAVCEQAGAAEGPKRGPPRNHNGTATEPQRAQRKHCKNSKTEPLEKPDSPLPGFETWWRAYPRRAKKPAAAAAYGDAVAELTARGHENPQEFLLERAAAFAASQEGHPVEYCPYPATWLHDKQFDDDPSTLPAAAFDFGTWVEQILDQLPEDEE